MRTIVGLLFMLETVFGFSSFQPLIPNGSKVPNPCSTTGGVWPGVGHLNLHGGGPRNPFGNDFQLAGHEWNSILCQKDSDGDGKTNGQELGDPQCTFSVNTNVPLSTPTGHPGICEPIGSTLCTSHNFTCPI